MLVGIVDVSVVETGGIAVALGVFQRFVEVACVGILLQLQIAVSHAIDDVFAIIAVERPLAHLAIGGEGVVVVAVIKFQVGNAHQHVEHQIRRGIVGGESAKLGKGVRFVALQSAQCHIIVGIFFERCLCRQFLHPAHLIDGAGVVVVFIHEFAALKIALGIA